MNRLNSPTLRQSKYTRFSGKRSLVVLRYGSASSILVPTGATTASGRRPGSCFVIDKIHVHGRSNDFDTNEFLQLVIKDTADDTYATLSIHVPNGNAATRQGTQDWQMDFGGRVAVPENFTLTPQNTDGGANAPFTSGIAVDVFGYYMPVAEAHRAGVTMWGAGDGFVASAIPANTTATELVAARAGYAIQVQGYVASGQIHTTTGSLLISHYDTTTDRGVFKEYQSVANIMSPLRKFCPTLDFEVPTGHSLRYTAAGNVVNRIAVIVWGKYTKTPTTFNPYGFHSIKGVATSVVGAPSTAINDTERKWTASQFVGRTLKIVGGTGAGSTGVITANTATQITCGAGFVPPVTLDDTSEYEVEAGMGNKFWAFVDNVNADARDTAYQIVDERVGKYAVVRNVMFSAECGAASSLATSAAQLVSATTTRKGSTLDNLGTAFGALAALDLTAPVTSPILGPPGLGDTQYHVNDVELPMPVTGLTAQLEVTHAWTGFSCHVSGVLKPPTAYSSKTAALAGRYQGGA